MSLFYWELPTTGAVTFGEILEDRTGTYTEQISNATSSRAQVRGVLKETKRMGAQKDYLRVIKVVEDYLPQLGGIIDCVFADELVPQSQPKFSWRSTLSSHLLKNSPRVEGLGFYYELCFCLLTYAYSLSDLAHATVLSLGAYELESYTSEAERKEKDEQLNFAARTLCRAAGVFKYIPDVILPEWAKVPSYNSKRGGHPPDLSAEVLAALPKIAMASANALAIRKLMTRAVAESLAVPGSALPKSHPSPSLLGKLWTHVHAEYSTARSLLSKSSALLSRDEVDADLRRYLDRSMHHSLGMAFKWFGVDHGERGKNGAAIAFLQAAREELSELKEGRGGGSGSEGQGGKGKGRRVGVEEELEDVGQWLRRYQVANDSITFEPIPSKAQIRATVPDGISVLKIQPFTLPRAAFGPSTRAGAGGEAGDGDGFAGIGGAGEADYVRAGQYF